MKKTPIGVLIFFIFSFFLFTSCSMNLDGSENENTASGDDAQIDDSLLSSPSDSANTKKEQTSEDLGNLLTEEVVNKNPSEVKDMKIEETPSSPVTAMEETNTFSAAPTPVALVPMGGGNYDPNGKFETYTVEKQETLMWVAFKLYGDYRMWKSLAKWNGSKITSMALSRGQEIKYIPSDFKWQPKGNPYLIQKGDYLSKISYKVYGTHKRWRSIWENNRPMIRYPDLIFAGFTLYYIPLRKEEIAYGNQEGTTSSYPDSLPLQ